MSAGDIEVQIACGTRERQVLRRLRVAADCTVRDAVVGSGVLDEFPGLDPATVDFALHGVRVDADRVPDDGDRIEVLRPLSVDPREARRRRAARRR